jgi:glyoxylase-like metal-dependent hydrolase (beta-lactamase superfamily II)
MRTFLMSVGIASLALSSTQTSTAEPAFPLRDAGARMERVGERAYAIIHDDATEEWPHGNTGVIVGDDGVLVVDATYLPSRARADIALIRSVTDQPVRYLAYTHWHFDHNNGAIAYREAFPQVIVVCERETREFVALNSLWWARRSARPDQPKRVALTDLERQLESGRNSAGEPLSAAAKAKLETNIRQRRSELEELASLEVVTPDLVFDRELTLFLGARRIHLRDWGRANSPHDVTIHVPDGQILFTGDILVQSPLPYLFESWPAPWTSVLREIESIPVTALVPGHGPVLNDHAYTRQVRALLEATLSRVADMARKGLSLEEIQRDLDLSDVRKSVPAWRAAEFDEDWNASMRALIERAWRGVRGQGG